SGAPLTAAGTWRAAVERTIAHHLLARVGDAPIAMVLPCGEEVRRDTAPPIARIRVTDTGTLLALLGPTPEIHFGGAYADGRIEVDGALLGLLCSVFAAPEGGWVARAASWWRWLQRRGNSIGQARRNVHHHYDLGNEFYRL